MNTAVATRHARRGALLRDDSATYLQPPRFEPQSPRKVDLSVVVPMYNEEAVVDVFFSQIIPVLQDMDLTWEIVCVNDGSRDQTLGKLQEYAVMEPRIVIVDLSRNFGKEAAMTAGLDHARGDAVVPIDADLQDPPALIMSMVTKWREGYEVVYATRSCRESDNWLKRWTASAFYVLFNRLAEIQIPTNTGDFRLMDRKVVEALGRFPERTRFMKGIFAWTGFRQVAVTYERSARVAGSTKWRYWKLWNFALDGVTSFTTLPLRVWSYIGSIVAALAFFYGIFITLRTMMFGVDVPGYASLMVVMLFLGGAQLLSLGVMGEYIGRICQEVKQRPVYIVRSVLRADAGTQ